MAAGRTATLTIHLAVCIVAAALTRHTAALARRTAALAAPGTTKLLVIGIVKGDRRVNAAGPGRVRIAVRQRGLLRWGLNEGVIAGPNGGGMINHLLFLTQEINKRLHLGQSLKGNIVSNYRSFHYGHHTPTPPSV